MPTMQTNTKLKLHNSDLTLVFNMINASSRAETASTAGPVKKTSLRHPKPGCWDDSPVCHAEWNELRSRKELY